MSIHLEVRDLLFTDLNGDDRDPKCADCGKRKPDVGEFTSFDGTLSFCTECGEKEAA
jgi:hypothetical protein